MRAIIFFLALSVTTITYGQGFGLFIGDGPCPFPDGCGVGDQNGGGEIPDGGWVPTENCRCGGGTSDSSGDDTTAEFDLPPCPPEYCDSEAGEGEEGSGHCCNCCCSKCRNQQAEEMPTVDTEGNKDSDGDGCPDWKDEYPDDSTRGCEDRKLPWDGKEEHLNEEWNFKDWLPVSQLEFEGKTCCEYLIPIPSIFGTGGGIYLNLSTCLGEGYESIDAWRVTIRGWLVVGLGWLFTWRAILKLGS